jgi:hypothetical protein
VTVIGTPVSLEAAAGADAGTPDAGELDAGEGGAAGA